MGHMHRYFIHVYEGVLLSYLCFQAQGLRDTHDMPYNFSDVVLTQHDRPIF